ncbi:MAG TPA: SH3 domain-containing protein [Gemmatimonadales bacterium]|nr:SH3 domain-containing protein [Gemmatimonadales bacterium]
MQVSQIVSGLLAVVCLAAPSARSQTGGRYRVTAGNAWFYQDVAGRRIARLAKGTLLTGGDTRDDWIRVTLEGWIFATSVTRSAKPDYDFIVTKTPNENLRAAPAGPLVAELAQGFGLKRATPDSSGRWLHVTRDGWVQRRALEPVAGVVSTRTAADTAGGGDTTQTGQTPAPRVGPDSAKVDSTRAQPTRMTTFYRAPDVSSPEAGTIATDTPLRILSRNGEWTRVQFEGWVKGADLQAAPAGVLVGVTAAELRAEPQRYAGQTLRWNLEFIAIQKADELRPDIPTGATYVLARGPLPERGFVYVIVPDNKLPTFRALTPLAPIQIIARVRNGRSRYLGNPVVDLISIEGGSAGTP